MALIHGPPGTGKTTAVVELIRRAIRRGEKVLACARAIWRSTISSSGCWPAGERVVRLGHPARVLAGIARHTLDLLVDEHPDVRLARKLVKEAMGLFRRADRYTRAKPEPGARQETRQEARSLLDDARRLERRRSSTSWTRPTCCAPPLTGLDSELLGTRRFDLAVIDEACQSVEPGCWIPLLRCDRVVLAGDHCQLPPTVVSQPAAAEGFGREPVRAADAAVRPGRRPAADRPVPHAQAIMDFSSLEFYEAELEADDSVAGTCWATCPAWPPRR